VGTCGWFGLLVVSPEDGIFVFIILLFGLRYTNSKKAAQKSAAFSPKIAALVNR
jgi:hypothetical protein